MIQSSICYEIEILNLLSWFAIVSFDCNTGFCNYTFLIFKYGLPPGVQYKSLKLGILILRVTLAFNIIGFFREPDILRQKS